MIASRLCAKLEALLGNVTFAVTRLDLSLPHNPIAS
jgi:hypothetical protein